MKVRFSLIVLLVAFALAGCSSHAPSASRFMAVKPNSISIGLSGGGVLGDDNSHREEKVKPINTPNYFICLMEIFFLGMIIFYLV